MNEDGMETTDDNSAGAFAEEKRIGVRLWLFTEAGPSVNVLFSCRHSGLSSAPYDSLNIGFFVEDEANRVHKNRQLLGRALGHKASCITSPRQRHSAEVGFLDSEFDIGAGSRMVVSNPYDPCDAMVTSLKSAPLLLQFADCVPVVLSGEVDGRPIIGVAHAGRLSLVGGIVTNIVEAMAAKGATRGALRVALGPAIGPCCYQVDGEKAAEFRDRFGEAAVDGDSIDLKYGVAADLDAAGVASGNIHSLDICTSCNENFFSHRRDGPKTGRQGAIAWIE